MLATANTNDQVTKKKIIVTFTNEISTSEFEKAIEEIESEGGKITKDYRPVMQSFAAEIPEGYDLDGFKRSFTKDEDELLIEDDGTVTTQKSVQ